VATKDSSKGINFKLNPILPCGRIEEPPKVLVAAEEPPQPLTTTNQEESAGFNPFKSILPSFFSANRNRIQERVQVAGALPVTVKVINSNKKIS
jgi:hypothetical protein